ncbi:MAG: biotin/lipoyl-binding protein, partial [Acidobacteria bacterium]|nr:biotin/lipoyl-binding protein [Acidobacteriota bacterium]
MTHKRAALWMFASVGLVATAGVGVTTRLTGQSAQPRVSTVAVARGDVVELVSATGTLEAVTTVNVGSQVSGTVQTLYADFNDLVRKGHVLARLDPSLFQTQVEQARASVTKAEADVQRQQVALDSSRLALERTKKLAAKRLVADADLEAADVDVRTAEAQLRSSAAAVAQARASLNQAEVNLANTVIVSP